MYQCKMFISHNGLPSLEDQVNTWFKSMKDVQSFDIIDAKLSSDQSQAMVMVTYFVVEDENDA